MMARRSGSRRLALIVDVDRCLSAAPMIAAPANFYRDLLKRPDALLRAAAQVGRTEVDGSIHA